LPRRSGRRSGRPGVRGGDRWCVDADDGVGVGHIDAVVGVGHAALLTGDGQADEHRRDA
jgi:hypothetical protein